MPETGAKCLQKSIGANPDGVVGPKTIAILKKMDADYVLEQMHNANQTFYKASKHLRHLVEAGQDVTMRLWLRVEMAG